MASNDSLHNDPHIHTHSHNSTTKSIFYAIMIVVFVVDTSPSMGQPISSSSSLSRLDVAKMAVEDLTKGLSRRINDHNVFLQHQPPSVQKSFCQMGLAPAAEREETVTETLEHTRRALELDRQCHYAHFVAAMAHLVNRNRRETIRRCEEPLFTGS